MVRLPHQVGSIPNPTHQSCYHVWLAASEETIPNCIIPKWTLSLYQVQQRRPFQTQLTNHVLPCLACPFVETIPNCIIPKWTFVIKWQYSTVAVPRSTYQPQHCVSNTIFPLIITVLVLLCRLVYVVHITFCSNHSKSLTLMFIRHVSTMCLPHLCSVQLNRLVPTWNPLV